MVGSRSAGGKGARVWVSWKDGRGTDMGLRVEWGWVNSHWKAAIEQVRETDKTVLSGRRTGQY